MGPPRKKSVNKRFLSEVSPDKEVKNSNKIKQQKGKLSKLGPRWSEGELQRFYKAYKKYGHDWQKVATAVRNRSVEMVEALYSKNQAYLNLPVGMGSALGLIAMMTDHYNVLEASDSDRESNDVPEIDRKSPKRKRPKVQVDASRDGCLSLLKRGRFDGGQPRVVGKRTPRFPVSMKRDDTDHLSPKKKGRKSEFDGDDDEVAHDAALVLAVASQHGGSPQVGQTPCRRSENVMSSPARNWDRMSGSALAKLRDASIHEDWSEGGNQSKSPHIGANAKSLVEMECVGTVEVHRKGRKFYGKKLKVEEIGNSHSDDGEACSGTEGQRVSSLKDKVNIEVPNAKDDESYVQSQKRRSKLFSGDEVSGLDPLQTLAHISLLESESSIHLNEDTNRLDMDGNSSLPEAKPTSDRGSKSKPVGEKGKGHLEASGREDTISRKPKPGRQTLPSQSLPEAKRRQQSINNNMSKRKPESLVSKAFSTENSVDPLGSKALETEALNEQNNTSVVKGKQTSQISSSPSKQSISIRGLEGSLHVGHRNPESDLAVTTAQVPVANKVILQTGKVNRRKITLKKAFQKEKSSDKQKSEAIKNSISYNDRVLSQKGRLPSCLSSFLARRWCMFEWFYSAIDYPWFVKREFEEYLNHVGLGHIPRLTRVEWGVIRSSLGKPRRFSERFLHEEREKLEHYRDSVRKHYTELRTGIKEGVPTDLARPLSVGQRVIAVHPKTREFHDGSVLTVDHDRCRVQFDCPNIGVEFVKDIDCMPSNPLDNMPEALKRQIFPIISNELQVNGHANAGRLNSSKHLENAWQPMNAFVKQPQLDTITNVPKPKATACNVDNSRKAICSQPYKVVAPMQAEADIQAPYERTHVLDKQEAYLKELKNTNNEILENQNNGDNSPKDSLAVRKHLATVLVQLKEASDLACSVSESLWQQNGHPANTLPANSMFASDLSGSYKSSFASQESRSPVFEIVKGSRLKAQTMVDAAIQAISSMEEGEDPFVRIGEALDFVSRRQLASESRTQVISSSEQVNGHFHRPNQSTPVTLEPQANGNASGPKERDESDRNEATFPSELITQCVAALLMIQKCTERQYPPTDVAQIIDAAVSSIHPCCPQNLPLYREIQMCMGIIKNQILALVPT